MKRRIAWVILLPALCFGIWQATRMMQKTEVSVAAGPAEVGADAIPPTTISVDAEEVFKRAFWKRPIDGDRIVHAERREWEDADGVDRWQWFIAVDPSDELARYLNEQNPFGLSDPGSKVAIPPPPRPEWFPSSAAGFRVSQSRDGQMLLMFDVRSGRLFATSRGGGFAKPLDPERSSPAARAPADNAGRLPTTPPVAPER